MARRAFRPFAFAAAVMLAGIPLAAPAQSVDAPSDNAQAANAQAAMIRKAATDFVHNRFVASCNGFGALYASTKHFHTLDAHVVSAFRVGEHQNGDSFANDTKAVLRTKNYPEACTLAYVTALAYLHEGKIGSADRISSSAAELQALVAKHGTKDHV